MYTHMNVHIKRDGEAWQTEIQEIEKVPKSTKDVAGSSRGLEAETPYLTPEAPESDDHRIHVCSIRRYHGKPNRRSPRLTRLSHRQSTERRYCRC